ncbi:hypothetical protein F4781DRAFT_395927 [Annulohypoxylon bovei var. microspora]|nr:hypothetical protein F4781DRAFT_395927 [Annulohypoxylon bovei var. microspora]
MPIQLSEASSEIQGACRVMRERPWQINDVQRTLARRSGTNSQSDRLLSPSSSPSLSPSLSPLPLSSSSPASSPVSSPASSPASSLALSPSRASSPWLTPSLLSSPSPSTASANSEEASAEPLNTQITQESLNYLRANWPSYTFYPIVYPFIAFDKAKYAAAQRSWEMDRAYHIYEDPTSQGYSTSDKDLLKQSPEPQLPEEQHYTMSTPTSPLHDQLHRRSQNHLQQSIPSRITRCMKRRVTRQTRQRKGQGNKNLDFWELDQNGCPCRTAK